MEPTAERKRRLSKDLPPELSLFIKTLTAHKTSYIEAFNSRENRMRQIVRELKEIAAEVKEMQRDTNTGRKAGAVTAGVGLGVGLLFAPFTGGLSLVAAGAAAAVGGGAAVATSNVGKILSQKGSAKQVKKLGEEFLKLVEPLKEQLKTIQNLFKEFEEKSAAAQTETKKFKRILYRIYGLREQTGFTLTVVTGLNGVMSGLLMLIMGIFRVTATPEEDKELTDSIIQSADQSQKVVEAFQKMSQELRDTVQDIVQTATEVDDLPEPKTRAEFLQYSCDITLDPNTVNTHLLLSDQNRKATYTGQTQSYSSHPDRFTDWPQVLSEESLTGRCYWEVEWRGRVYVTVTYKNISRAGDSHECLFGHNDKSWSLDCDNNRYYFWYNKVWTPVSGPQSSRVGVYLDHRAGILSFYSISETMTLLHRVQTTFTQPVHVGLGLYDYDGSSAEVCKL